MTNFPRHFDKIIDYIWENKATIFQEKDPPDYPDYYGMRKTLGISSPDVVDALQNIWDSVITTTSKDKLKKLYLAELKRLGMSRGLP